MISALRNSHQAKPAEATISMKANNVPADVCVNGRFCVFMPKKPVTSVGGIRKAVRIDRM